MTPADIRKLARQNEVGGTAIDQRTAAALRACADVVEAVGSPEKLIAPDFDKLHTAIARLEAL